MSKTNKRNKRHGLIERDRLSDRNRRLYDELERSDAELSGKDMAVLKDTFSRERILTYLAFIFCPPVGIYRLWYRFSTFTMAERYLWTFMIAAAMAKLITILV
ncbi:MAG: hypothetical protein K6G84_10165 [Lachnospiraceae bacterium]|nr:hypothetical protein [Lachnospiraceae bacterium]